MSDNNKLLDSFCQAVNAVKRVSLSSDSVNPDQYLGGDLGIDSVEMLEIWFRIEKSMGSKIPDTAKRDIYTVGEVLAVVAAHLTSPITGE